MNFTRCILLLFPIIFIGRTFAITDNIKSKYLFKHVTLTAGNWYDFLGDVQVNKDGDTSSFSDFEINPYFAISADYYFKPRWTINPEIGYVWRKDAGDSKISKDLFFIRGDFTYFLTEKIRIRGGTSFMILTMSGDGGEETVNNGDGTQIYYRPSQRSTALNQTLDFGAEYIFNKLTLRYQTYIYDFTDKVERKYSHSLSLNFMIPLERVL